MNGDGKVLISCAGCQLLSLCPLSVRTGKSGWVREQALGSWWIVVHRRIKPWGKYPMQALVIFENLSTWF